MQEAGQNIIFDLGDIFQTTMKFVTNLEASVALAKTHCACAPRGFGDGFVRRAARRRRFA